LGRRWTPMDADETEAKKLFRFGHIGVHRRASAASFLNPN
jgi:hypothetical protein